MFFISENFSIFAPKLRKKIGMTKLKDKFNRLFSGQIQHLDSSDLTAKTKTRLYLSLKPHGMTQSTFYLRLFNRGFEAWEIHGIHNIKKTFIRTHEKELRAANEGSIRFRNNDGSFYEALRKAELITVFKAYMFELGMSLNTTTQRFSTDNWKSWEQKGIKSLVEQFLERYDEET